MKEDLISVIIPLYNTEDYIERCITSILNNTYRNIEIIVVDDGSSDNSRQIVSDIAKKRKNVRLVSHPENRGLFESRLTGFSECTGQYVAFVDADDYVSSDWFRMLHETISEAEADIAIGQFLLDYSDGTKAYDNLDPLRQKTVLSGDKVIDTFMTTAGKHYSLQLVWNKLYKRELWEAAFSELEAFSKKTGHLIMCEDIAFSIALWARAERVVNFTYGAFYYYFKHEGQSTAVENNKGKNSKNIRNVGLVFDFMSQVLERLSLREKYNGDFEEWKLDYANLYYRQFSAFDRKYYIEIIKNSFNLPEKLITKERPFNTIYSISTSIDTDVLTWGNLLKDEIADTKTEAVSFDIFDTLILRPFVSPADLFKLLNNTFYKLFHVNTYYDFKEIRVKSEERARRINSTGLNGKEEVTLDEIYERIALDYGFEREKLEAIKKREMELERELCYVREYGKQLFKLAKYLGKRIFITSDMYLPRSAVEGILEKNGYDGYSALYLSSDAGITKHSGNLFRYLLKTEGLISSSVLHVGDNWESDVQSPLRLGMRAFHLPPPTDILYGRHGRIYGGEILTRSASFSGIHDLGGLDTSYVGYSAMLGLIANKLFDCPYVHYNTDSDFNCDPFVIGYSALGPYLYAVADWVLDNAKKEGVGTVHFVARDGHLPMLAFNVIKNYVKAAPEANYLYVSRKSMLLSDIYTPNDVYSLTYKLNSTAYTPKKLLSIFRPFLNDSTASVDDVEIFTLIGINNMLKDTPFKSHVDFEVCAKELFALCNGQKLDLYRDKLKNYFSGIIKEGDAIFDIGYSGRQELALSKLLGFTVNGMYIHSNNEILNCREKIGGFHTKTFYDKKPVITGVIREHVFMKLAPSTVGYEESGCTLKPIFEEMTLDRVSTILTEIMQTSALEFIEDYLSFFGKYKDSMYYRKDDFAYLFEYYLHHSKYEDKKVFGSLVFEDDLGTGKKFRAIDFWCECSSYIDVNKYVQNKSVGTTAFINEGLARRVAGKLLPKGTKRRELIKKIYKRATR